MCNSFVWGRSISVCCTKSTFFNFRDKGEVQGLGVDLLNASLSSLRPKLSQEEIRLDVWKDVYAGALAHPSSFHISTARLKEREAFFNGLTFGNG